MPLCTRTCVLSTVLWVVWLVGTCLCLSCGTSIPIKMLALRYLPDFCTAWMDGTWCVNFRLKATLWKNMQVKFSRTLVFFSGQLETLLPSLRGVGPLLRRSASTLVVDCEASEQWKTVSDWTAQPLMESTSTIAPPEARRRKVTPEGRNKGGQVVCAATADIL